MSERKTIDQREKEVLAFWKENDVFKKSLDQTREGEPFVFFEGPPTANGRPGVHHILARTLKDIFPRYQTMRGRFVLRKGGWDTHGLPVEVEVEKELGLSSKKEIEEYGIAEFNAKCKESVWRYKEEWEELTERMGFWINLDDPYITYEPRYMETLWWIVKKIHERGLLEKAYLVTPYCPRCGTTLSSHEVAQGYKTVTDPAVTVRFPLKDDTASLLAWTTTPWTLLANVAAAVHPELEYVRVTINDEEVILAKPLLASYAEDAEIIEEMKGSDLVGREYEPPYTIVPEVDFVHTVVAADYVSAAEGTGIVHLAPFGEEDMAIIRELGLPAPVPIDPDGHVTKEATQFAGLFVKDADKEIIEDLKQRGILFRSDDIEHEYPFCWRCDSPLLYYPRESWMVRMASLRDELKERNDRVTWVPGHMKEGRFGQWIEEVKDWNFSRERYWGTPLPIWQCGDCDEQTVIGGLKDFPIDNRNTFFAVRHGEADHNVDHGLAGAEREKNNPPHLTEIGKKEAQQSAALLKDKGVTKIIASPYIRTQETAAIVAQELGVKVETDDRLRELSFGSAKTAEEYHKLFNSRREYFERNSDEGEGRRDVQARMVHLVKELNEQHAGETIALVTHGDPLWLLQGAFAGWSYEELLKEKAENYPLTGSFTEIPVRLIPTDREGYIDFHRPFVDEIELPCDCGGVQYRVPEVIDVWFDSGSMPFAQWHYPFEYKGVVDGGGSVGSAGHVHEAWKEDSIPAQYPAHIIAEGLDQTRGWFYTMLAVATLLEKKEPYRAVVSHGLVLDEEGKKMSKSKGNIMDPWDLFEKFGADAVRWTFVTMNPVGEAKKFGETEIQDRLRRVFDTVRNVVRFYGMYKSDNDDELPTLHNVLDRWIVSRLQGQIKIVRESFDNWMVQVAGREIESFIDDLSNWYVRRSRRRFQQPESADDHNEASATLRYALRVLSQLMAPIAPFIAEEIYQVVRRDSDVESVHLSEFPEYDESLGDGDVLAEMFKARDAVSEGLRLRVEAEMSIRQPLSSFVYPEEFSEEVSSIIADELNVKEFKKGGLHLETKLTEELRQEGFARELARTIQSLRRKARYRPIDRITVGMTSLLQSTVGSYLSMVQEIVKADAIEDIERGSWDAESEVSLDEITGSVGVRRLS